jgi:hypothetical protein
MWRLIESSLNRPRHIVELLKSEQGISFLAAVLITQLPPRRKRRLDYETKNKLPSKKSIIDFISQEEKPK